MGAETRHPYVGETKAAAPFHAEFNAINTAPFPVTMDLGAFVSVVAPEWVFGRLVLPAAERARSLAVEVPATL